MDNKKRIVIVGPAYPYRGGNSLYISFLYDLLKDFYDVKVVNYKLLYPSFLFPGTTQQDVSNHIIKTVESKRLINSINPFTWLKTASYINSLNPDLILFDWWNPFFGPSHRVISSFIKKSLKPKIVFITENVISHEARFIDRFLTRIGLKNARAFIALSNIVDETLKKFSDKKIYRSSLPVYDCYNIQPDVNIEITKSGLGFKSSDFIILFFGYVRKYKGLNVLIDAMPAVIKSIPDAKLLIVGEFYDTPEPYYTQIKKLGLENNVKVVQKFVPNEDVGLYYSVSDIVILPYREATQSGVLNIAYGFSKPVIVTNVGGLAEDVTEGKTGYIIPPENHGEISNAILKFYNEKNNVDFKTNIQNKLKENLFFKFPELIDKILKDIV